MDKLPIEIIINNMIKAGSNVKELSLVNKRYRSIYVANKKYILENIAKRLSVERAIKERFDDLVLYNPVQFIIYADEMMKKKDFKYVYSLMSETKWTQILIELQEKLSMKRDGDIMKLMILGDRNLLRTILSKNAKRPDNLEKLLFITKNYRDYAIMTDYSSIEKIILNKLK